MNQMKKLLPSILLIVTLLFLAACGSSLEKPTGLENNNGNETTNEVIENGNNSVDKKQESKEDKQAKEDEKDKQKDKQAKKDNESDTKHSKSDKATGNEVTKVEKKADSKNDAPKGEKNSTGSSSSLKKEASPPKSADTVKEKTTKQTEKKSSTAKSEPKKESQPKPKADKPPPKQSKKTVTLSIKISSSEVPLGATSVEINDGEKVVDALNRVTKAKGIHRDVAGGYVKGLANVYEFDRGQGSGWMYRINGVFPDRGVAAVPIQDGDRIEFLYTLDLGKDLNANLQSYR